MAGRSHDILALLLAVFLVSAATAISGPVRLSENGQAMLPVVIGQNANPRRRGAADTLAAYLSRISGGSFEVSSGDGAGGIVLGCPGEFGKLPFEVVFEGGPFNREEYVIRSSSGGLWLIGATDLAVEHAVWDLLYHFGYRQFFPGEAWEVVPSEKNLAIDIEVREKPDFYARRIWYNWGLWGYNTRPYEEWCARNRAVKGFDLNSGHSYEGIVAANRAEFEAHPEYGALVDGERKLSKFCISNPGLRKLVVEYARRTIVMHPELDSISMDPSDGGGWCECEACRTMGSVSDQALTLANDVAETINGLGLGGKYVGMYAYNQHCSPPTIRVHPNVIISATTAFIRGGFSLDQIITGWQKQGATLGIYDYYSVIAWDWNRPRGAKAARPQQLATSIRSFHQKGARFLDAESGDAWGPYGLGYYTAARTMWDIDEADHVDALVEDFLAKAFGPAKEPMAEFYRLISVDQTLRSSADVIGRMYRGLDEARKLAGNDAAVQKRLDHLVLYTRYAELYEQFAAAVGEQKETAKQNVLRHAYRMRKTMMVHTYGLWARLASQNAANAKDNPLHSDELFMDEELSRIVAAGMQNNQPVDIDFETVAYSEELVPAAEALGLLHVPDGDVPPVPQDHHNYFVWVDTAPADIKMQVTVQRVWNNCPHEISLFSPKAVDIKAVDISRIVKADGKPYDVVLKTPYTGLHRILVRDGGDYTRIVWPDDMPVTLPSSMETPGVKDHFRGAWTLYFYVPKGTQSVAGWASRIAAWAPRISGTLLDPTGKVLCDFSTVQDGWFNIPVPAGTDGKLWKFEQTHGTRQLVTVPPYFAVNAERLLLPREVVDGDRRQ